MIFTILLVCIIFGSDVLRWKLKKFSPTREYSNEHFELESLESVKKLKKMQVRLGLEMFSLSPLLVHSFVPGGEHIHEGFQQSSTSTGDPVRIQHDAAMWIVIESRNRYFKVGDRVMSSFDWVVLQSEWVVYPSDVKLRVLDRMVDMRHHISTLSVSQGITADLATAYVASPRKGDVVFVSSAGGGVGLLAAQLFQLEGATVIGSTGSDLKVEELKAIGIDHVFNYKNTSTTEALDKWAPNGINIYFDIVGGEILQEAFDRLARFGVVVFCGINSASTNDAAFDFKLKLFPAVIQKNIRLEGFWAPDWVERFEESQEKLEDLLDEEKLKVAWMMEDWEYFGDALGGMMRGENFGKMIIRGFYYDMDKSKDDEFSSENENENEEILMEEHHVTDASELKDEL